nr:MAG TPA: hypothetical protein [Bacteriophage sp.]
MRGISNIQKKTRLSFTYRLELISRTQFLFTLR